jgi:hypothetical protein
MTDDLSRQAATSPDEYTLTIDDALARYEHAGHPRTARSIQRYCAKGHLDCLRQETPFGEKYLVTSASVARHIAQIEELASTTGRDLPRPFATGVAKDQSQTGSPQDPPTSPDTSRPVAAYIERVEGENEFLRKQIDVKDGQLAVRDKTIEALLERDRETNILVNQRKRCSLRCCRNRSSLARKAPRLRDESGDNCESASQGGIMSIWIRGRTLLRRGKKAPGYVRRIYAASRSRRCSPISCTVCIGRNRISS